MTQAKSEPGKKENYLNKPAYNVTARRMRWQEEKPNVILNGF